MEDLIKIAEEVRKAEERAKRAEERLKKAEERASRARRRRQEITLKFLREYRKRTGISIRATQQALEWMAKCDEHIINAAFNEEKKCFISLINEARDWEELFRCISYMARMARQQLLLKRLGRHTEALKAAQMLGFLTEEEIKRIEKYSGGGENN